MFGELQELFDPAQMWGDPRVPGGEASVAAGRGRERHQAHLINKR